MSGLGGEGGFEKKGPPPSVLASAWPIDAGIHYFESLPPPGMFLFDGSYYFWDGSRWMVDGRVVSIPVKFIADPFQSVYRGANAKPQSVWGTGFNSPTGNPIQLSSHIDQMRLVRITAFMAVNSTLEIPLIDSNDVTYCDPAMVPLCVSRYNRGSTNPNNDYVDDEDNTNILWTDFRQATRASEGIQTQPLYSCTLKLEKEPTPHWVLVVGYTDNDTTSNNRSVLIHLVTNMAGGNYPTKEVGSAGVAGHYKITNCFQSTTFGGASDQGVANDPCLVRFEDYLAPSTPTTIYLTSDGTNTGSDLFQDSDPPLVIVFGHHLLATDAGSTESSWEPSTWGMGFNMTGTLSDGTSIRNANASDYKYYSDLRYASSRWAVTVENLGSVNRQFYILAFGRQDNVSPTKNTWTSLSVSPTDHWTDFQQRGFYLASVKVDGPGTVVWWTDDGLEGGTAILDSAYGPMVYAMVEDIEQRGQFTDRGRYGNMFIGEIGSSRDQWMLYSDVSGGKWFTEIWLGAPGDEGGETASGRGRVAHVYAMGRVA